MTKDAENKRKDNFPTLSSCLRQKLSSVICATESKTTNLTNKKREVTSGTLYNLLASALDNMPDGKQRFFLCLSTNRIDLLHRVGKKHANKFFSYLKSENCSVVRLKSGNNFTML